MRTPTRQTTQILGGLMILGLASSLRAEPVQKPTQSVPREGCVTAECHPGIKSMRFTHGPVGVDACDACHEEADPLKHTFSYPRTGQELCGFCHQLDLSGQYVHEPVAQGTCTECHDPHGGQERFMLRGGEGASSCARCHVDVTEGLPVVHGPVAAGICTTCHRPHSSDNPKLLAHSGPDLCLECHLSTKQHLERVRNIHGPVSVDCLACHRPHAAERKMMVKADTRELCLECHSQIAAVVQEATTTHGAVSTGQACRNCHDPHGSDYAAILINDMVEVCLSCHDREIDLEDGTKLMNMKAVLAEGTSLHGPIAQRSCVACHQIHGGNIFRLLFKEYPPEFYAPFLEESYALCFACHNRELVLDPRTGGLTDFRNGDLNLHYLHVNKDIKGRTCRACHETHASRKAKHIRDSVPFGTGGWKLPINYEKTETGGGCRPGCHRPSRYDRQNPLIYEPPDEPAIWPETTAAPAASQPTTRPEGG
ncbi:MAG: cytochrome c3 family protein [Phycisphaerales bacterium]|nr:MAG: cytochrome c3 family protein [Phycisphaerales bacterium]